MSGFESAILLLPEGIQPRSRDRFSWASIWYKGGYSRESAGSFASLMQPYPFHTNSKPMRSSLVLITFLPFSHLVAQSGFGPQQVIIDNTQSTDGARSVYATDLDGDGDADVLCASSLDDKIAWYENTGGGSFGSQNVITTSADGASEVYAMDLDGDGDPDVLSASNSDDKIAWYENIGAGTFGPQQVITNLGGWRPERIRHRPGRRRRHRCVEWRSLRGRLAREYGGRQLRTPAGDHDLS